MEKVEVTSYQGFFLRASPSLELTLNRICLLLPCEGTRPYETHRPTSLRVIAPETKLVL